LRARVGAAGGGVAVLAGVAGVGGATVVCGGAGVAGDPPEVAAEWATKAVEITSPRRCRAALRRPAERPGPAIVGARPLRVPGRKLRSRPGGRLVPLSGAERGRSGRTARPGRCAGAADARAPAAELNASVAPPAPSTCRKVRRPVVARAKAPGPTRSPPHIRHPPGSRRAAAVACRSPWPMTRSRSRAYSGRRGRRSRTSPSGPAWR